MVRMGLLRAKKCCGNKRGWRDEKTIMQKKCVRIPPIGLESRDHSSESGRMAGSSVTLRPEATFGLSKTPAGAMIVSSKETHLVKVG